MSFQRSDFPELFLIRKKCNIRQGKRLGCVTVALDEFSEMKKVCLGRKDHCIVASCFHLIQNICLATYIIRDT